MKNKLFVIGNGFDLAHNLPTKFDPDFKNIARKYEQDNFWDLYQSRENDIWSDFENLLGCPDFNTLEEIFDGYEPDYLSERESERDSIIYQVELNGNLQDALYEFADKADDSFPTNCREVERSQNETVYTCESQTPRQMQRCRRCLKKQKNLSGRKYLSAWNNR